MRLDKYLSKTILSSRSNAKEQIKKRNIYINGKVVTSESFKVNENDAVYFKKGDELILLEYEEYIYLMLNKPSGYVCANVDNLHKTVFELIPEYKDRDINCVGRLDLDTEGLLLLTDDGDFIHRVTSPKSNISKKYYVEFEGVLDKNSEEKVSKGITLDDGSVTKPGHLEILDKNKAYITIYDGKFHQVKRMFADLGTKVTYLKRVMIGKLDLDIECGKYKKLNIKEIDSKLKWL